MVESKLLLEATMTVGRHVGAGTTFERAAGQWRDGSDVVGIDARKLAELAELVKSPAFSACLRHPEAEVNTLAAAVLELTQQPRKRVFWWKCRDLLASDEKTVPIAVKCVRALQQARQQLWLKAYRAPAWG
jgi:hypothetical protein